MALSIAIVGATGLVGRELLRIIEADLPQARLGLFASASSAGKRLPFAGAELEVQELAKADFSQFNAALFCIGDELSAEYVPRALAAGCCVVDKSNAFRLDPQVPLVVAGVNDAAVASASRLCANPNCSTIILAHALAPLQRAFGLARVWASTYQSVSGAGTPGVERLSQQLRDTGSADELLARRHYDPAQFAYNVVPSIGRCDDLARCSEEAKLVEETRKILARPELPVIAHAVRVPVVVGHSISATVELKQPASLAEVAEVWKSSPDLAWMDSALPTPLGSARHDKAEVGRLRAEPGVVNGINFFVSGDNLRLGAALNGWRILTLMRAAGAVQESERAAA